ncbi:MAG TPA: hypothetical protein VEP90_24895, partial [Methylomirabilota bacterium]|nr:hypothetical protein [Methylomirabilota bacterium]
MAVEITSEQSNIEALSTSLENADTRMSNLQLEKQKLEQKQATLEKQKAFQAKKRDERKAKVEEARNKLAEVEQASKLALEQADIFRGTKLHKAKQQAWMDSVHAVGEASKELDALTQETQKADVMAGNVMRTYSDEYRKIQSDLQDNERQISIAIQTRGAIHMQLDAARREDFRQEIEALHEEFGAVSLHLASLQEKLDAGTTRAR